MDPFFRQQLYQPPYPSKPLELMLNPYAKELLPGEKVNINPFVPTVFKYYDRMTNQVKAVTDSNGRVMSEEEFNSQIENQEPFIQGSFPPMPVIGGPIINNPTNVNDEYNAPFNSIQKMLKKNNKNGIQETINCKYEILKYPFDDDKKILIRNNQENNEILYSGTGLILIEQIPNLGNFVVLVKSKRLVYEDFGGEISDKLILNDNILSNNTIKELLEESQGLFLAESKSLTELFSIPDDNMLYYKVYILVISYKNTTPNISKLYTDNRQIIGRYGQFNSLINDWYETYNIARFNLAELENNLMKYPYDSLKKDINLETSGSKKYKLRCRTAKILHSFFSSSIFDTYHELNINNVELTKNQNNRIVYFKI